MTHQAVLSAIEQELVCLEGYVSSLREKLQALQVAAPTDSAGTTETRRLPEIPVYLTSRGAIHPSGFWFAGVFHQCTSQIDIYIGLLRALAQRSDDALPRAAAALRGLGHSRCYLAPDRALLCPSQTDEWRRAHSRRVVDGWYADSNLSLALKQRLLRRIFRASGIREGVDVVILWQNTAATGAAIGQPGDRQRH